MSTVDNFDTYYTQLQEMLHAAKGKEELFNTIVDAPFHNKLYTTTLDLGIIVLLVVNKDTGTIDRVALSNTEPAQWAVKMTPLPFNEIKIPVGHKTNIIAKAFKTKQYQKTTDWKYLFVPALSEESARFNQAGAGIACSYVYPLKATKPEAAMIFSYYQPLDNLGHQHKSFMDTYTKLVTQHFVF